MCKYFAKLRKNRGFSKHSEENRTIIAETEKEFFYVYNISYLCGKILRE